MNSKRQNVLPYQVFVGINPHTDKKTLAYEYQKETLKNPRLATKEEFIRYLPNSPRFIDDIEEKEGDVIRIFHSHLDPDSLPNDEAIPGHFDTVFLADGKMGVGFSAMGDCCLINYQDPDSAIKGVVQIFYPFSDIWISALADLYPDPETEEDEAQYKAVRKESLAVLEGKGLKSSISNPRYKYQTWADYKGLVHEEYEGDDDEEYQDDIEIKTVQFGVTVDCMPPDQEEGSIWINCHREVYPNQEYVGSFFKPEQEKLHCDSCGYHGYFIEMENTYEIEEYRDSRGYEYALATGSPHTCPRCYNQMGYVPTTNPDWGYVTYPEPFSHEPGILTIRDSEQEISLNAFVGDFFAGIICCKEIQFSIEGISQVQLDRLDQILHFTKDLKGACDVEFSDKDKKNFPNFFEFEFNNPDIIDITGEFDFKGNTLPSRLEYVKDESSGLYNVKLTLWSGSEAMKVKNFIARYYEAEIASKLQRQGYLTEDFEFEFLGHGKILFYKFKETEEKYSQPIVEANPNVSERELHCKLTELAYQQGKTYYYPKVIEMIESGTPTDKSTAVLFNFLEPAVFNDTNNNDFPRTL